MSKYLNHLKKDIDDLRHNGNVMLHYNKKFLLYKRLELKIRVRKVKIMKQYGKTYMVPY